MALGKQAKTRTKKQATLVLSYLLQTRYPLRNKVVFLLSVKAGLRAKEISHLTWAMLTDAQRELASAIRLENNASKGRTGGRVIPLNH